MTNPPSTEGVLIERVACQLAAREAKPYPKATFLLRDIRTLLALATRTPEGPPDDMLVAVREELRSLSSNVGAGLAESENDLGKLVARVAWGVEHIQQVEAKRTADLIEELSKTPKTTWGQVKTAVLNRAGLGDPEALARFTQHKGE